MKKTLLFLSGLLTAGLVHSQTFNTAIGGSGADYGGQVIKTSDGGLLYVGHTPTVNSGDIVVIKTDNTGAISWENTYGTSSALEDAVCVTQLTGGDFVIGGYKLPGVDVYFDAILLRISSSGSIVSTQSYTNATGDNEMITAICATSDGGYAVTTNSWYSGTGVDLVVAKFTTSDVLSWQNHYYKSSESNPETAHAIQQTSDGGYIVFGNRTFTTTSSDLMLLKLTSTGSISWSKSFGTTGSETGYSVQITSDGGYVCCGSGYVVRTNSSGVVSGTGTFIKSYNASTTSICQNSSGDYIFAGGDDLVEISGTDGSVVWGKQHSGSTSYTNMSLAIASDGYLAFTGRTSAFGAGSSDIYLAKADASGVSCGTCNQTVTASSPTLTTQSGFLSGATSSISFSSLTFTSATYSGTSTSKCMCPVDAGADKVNNKWLCCATQCQSVQIGTASTGYTYSWTPTATLDNPTYAQPNASPCSATTYTLTVSGSGCLTSQDQVTVTVATSNGPCCGPKRLGAPDIDEPMVVSPNPAKDHVSIQFGESVTSVDLLRVTDALGRVVFEVKNGTTDGYTIDLSGQPAGVYIVMLQSGETVTTRNVVLQ